MAWSLWKPMRPCWLNPQRRRLVSLIGWHPPPCLPRQFDFTFVEVSRVKKFQFTSKHVDDEDSNLKENGKQGFGQICTDNPTCSCSSSRSSWNCDGEILHSPAIEVR